MVSTLIIDCTKSLDVGELKKALMKFSRCIVKRYNELEDVREAVRKVDCIVLSGSSARIVNEEERNRYLPAGRIALSSELPTLGICFGHQLASFILGAKVNTLGRVVRKFEEVRVLRSDELFDGFDVGEEVVLAKAHYDYVVKTSLEEVGLILLADSASCEVEAVKLRRKPIYGVQFHPERMMMDGEVHEEGHEVLKNFFIHVVHR